MKKLKRLAETVRTLGVVVIGLVVETARFVGRIVRGYWWKSAGGGYVYYASETYRGAAAKGVRVDVYYEGPYNQMPPALRKQYDDAARELQQNLDYLNRRLDALREREREREARSSK